MAVVLIVLIEFMGSSEDPQLSGGSGSGDSAIFGVLTVSDRASQGVYEDTSGPAILSFFREAVKTRYSPIR